MIKRVHHHMYSLVRFFASCTMRNKKLFFTAFAFNKNLRLKTAACLAGCFFFFGCENDLEEIKRLQQNQVTVDEVKQVTSYLSTGGKLKAKLTAPFMLRYYDTVPRVEFPNTLHVDFYNDSMQIESYLDAKKASYYEQQSRVILTDSVVVIRIDGDTLITNELFWEQNLHKLFTNSDVEIRQKTKTIYGKGFESDEQLKNFRIDTPKGFILVGASKFGGN
ncbi:MAG: LPS export ABC transporter periplasmic protein LptC [Chitinophagaceae bacterium]|jgi:LPS export ABC transporter protein LptC|nr:LPS export ABC transporter periplasmic protein LptC [Chitinophagaceae bacterium]